MGLKIPLLLLFLYVTTILCVPRKSSTVLRFKNQICPCFKLKSDLAKIPKILDPKNIGIERLVIFAYRTPNGNIYTYIPNKNKQLLFPDLEYELSDSLDTDNAHKPLETIFLNHYRVNTPSSLLKNFEISQENESDIPEYLEDDGEIEINNHKPRKIKNDHRPFWSDPVVNDFEPDISDMSVEDYDDDTNTPKILFDDTSLEPIKPKDELVKVSVPNIKNIYRNRLKQPYIPLTPIRKDPRVIITSGTEKYVVPSGKDSQSANLFPINEDMLNFNPDSSKQKHQVPVPFDSFIKQRKSNKQPINYGFSHTLRKANQPTFDKWFITQMQNMALGQSTKLPIDYKSLHYFILAALKRHGLIVSKRGELRDSKGHILNMSNIILRRLLISDSLDYHKVKANPDGTILFPKKSTYYMEVLLITFLYPHKIIAIIPLGKTFIQNNLDSSVNIQRLATPSRLENKPSGFTSVKSKNIKNGFELRNPLLNNEEMSQIADGEPTYNIDSVPNVSKPFTIPTKDIKSIIPVPKANEDIQSDLQLTEEKQNKTIAQHTLTQNETKENNTLTPKLDKMAMNSLLDNIFGDLKDVATGAGKVLDQYPPGIRIIGGSAAINSGAPISNRGKRFVSRL